MVILIDYCVCYENKKRHHLVSGRWNGSRTVLTFMYREEKKINREQAARLIFGSLSQHSTNKLNHINQLSHDRIQSWKFIGSMFEDKFRTVCTSFMHMWWVGCRMVQSTLIYCIYFLAHHVELVLINFSWFFRKCFSSSPYRVDEQSRIYWKNEFILDRCSWTCWTCISCEKKNRNKWLLCHSLWSEEVMNSTVR